MSNCKKCGQPFEGHPVKTVVLVGGKSVEVYWHPEPYWVYSGAPVFRFGRRHKAFLDETSDAVARLPD